MIRTLGLCIAAVSLLGSQAFAQSAATTTVNIQIKNSMVSSPISIQSASCNTNSTAQCTPIIGSIAATQSKTGSVATTSTSSGSYLQNWSGTVGTQSYACNFQTFIAANFSGGCHTFTTGVSASAGPGGGHPNCQVVGTPVQPTGSSCTGSVIFSITQ